MSKYSLSIVLLFSMIFSLMVLSVRKVEALCNDLNAPYKYTYSTTIHFEGETLSQRIAKTASCELKLGKYHTIDSNKQYCGGLYGGYGGLYSVYGGFYGLYSGYWLYGGLY